MDDCSCGTRAPSRCSGSCSRAATAEEIRAWAGEIAEAVRDTSPDTGMARLSVNVNKVATIRNSRGGRVPSVTDAVRVCVGAGAPGITVHPRADNRHITPRRRSRRGGGARAARGPNRIQHRGGSPRGLVTLVCEVRADQATLVPVMPGERTSQAGWRLDTPPAHLRGVDRPAARRRGACQPVRGPGATRDRLGRVARRRPRRALHRAVRASVRTGGRRMRRRSGAVHPCGDPRARAAIWA